MGKSAAILGMSWLRNENPQIYWANMTITLQEETEKLLVRKLTEQKPAAEPGKVMVTRRSRRQAAKDADKKI
jgi:hypothetical protein